MRIRSEERGVGGNHYRNRWENCTKTTKMQSRPEDKGLRDEIAS